MSMNQESEVRGGRGETTEYVYNLLKEMILDRQLSPGQKINISLLSRELNVSTIPVRGALSRLQSSKLVTLKPNKGYFVSNILERSKMLDMFEARILIETHAVKNIINSSNLGVIQTLECVTEKMSVLNVDDISKSSLKFSQLDNAFHYSLVSAGGNYFLTEAYDKMYCHLHIARFYHLIGRVDQQEATVEHWEIIECIRQRDLACATLAITNHIQDAKSRILG